MANDASFKTGQESGQIATPQQIPNAAKRTDHNAGAAQTQKQQNLPKK